MVVAPATSWSAMERTTAEAGHVARTGGNRPTLTSGSLVEGATGTVASYRTTRLGSSLSSTPARAEKRMPSGSPTDDGDVAVASAANGPGPAGRSTSTVVRAGARSAPSGPVVVAATTGSSARVSPVTEKSADCDQPVPV